LTLFLRHPRTPISTLSPYTTLFRSNNLGEARTEHKALCLPSWVQLYRRRAPHFGPHRTVIDSLTLAFRPVHSGNRREGIRPNGQKVASLTRVLAEEAQPFASPVSSDSAPSLGSGPRSAMSEQITTVMSASKSSEASVAETPSDSATSFAWAALSSPW